MKSATLRAAFLFAGLAMWLSHAEAVEPKAVDGSLAEPRVSVAVGPNAGSVVFSLKTGADPSRATLSFEQGGPRVLSFRTAGSKVSINRAKSRKEPLRLETFALEDHYIAVSGLSPRWKIDCFVRPNLACYPKDMQLDYVRKWDQLRRASEHFLDVEIRLDANGLEIWLEGRYCGRIDGPRPVGLTVAPGQGTRCLSGAVAAGRYARNIPFLRSGKPICLRTCSVHARRRAGHGSIRLKVPVEIPGKPNTVGVTVKGNSSRARLGFDFIDAEGETWTTCGGDWPANLSVNFDGWHFVRFPLDSSAKWPHHLYPNWIAGHWSPSGHAGNKRIDYPIKLVGISVLMPRKVLNLTEMKDVKRPSLCFKDFGAYTDAEPEVTTKAGKQAGHVTVESIPGP